MEKATLISRLYIQGELFHYYYWKKQAQMNN